jgi:hypothetical protein
MIVSHGGATGRGGFIPAGGDVRPDLAPHVPGDMVVKDPPPKPAQAAPPPAPPAPQAAPPPAEAPEVKTEAKSEPKAAGGPPKGPPVRSTRKGPASPLTLPTSAAEARALKPEAAATMAQTLGVDTSGVHEDIVERLVGELGLE